MTQRPPSKDPTPKEAPLRRHARTPNTRLPHVRLPGPSFWLALMTLTLALALIWQVLSRTEFDKSKPLAREGILDLRGWKPESLKQVRLDGEWEFYWKELLPKESPSKSSALDKSASQAVTTENPGIRAPAFMTVPRSWNGYRLGEETLSSQGWASFRLKILLPETPPGQEPPPLALRIPDFLSAHATYIDGKLFNQAGRVGTNLMESIPKHAKKVLALPPLQGSVELIVQISNYHHHRGGFHQSLILGERESMFAERTKGLTQGLFLAATFFVMSLYHLLIYFLKRDLTGYLWFGIFSLLMALRTLFIGEVYLTYLIEATPWSLVLHGLYLTFYLGVPFFALTLYNFYPDCFHRTLLWLILSIGGFYSLMVILTPVRIFSMSVTSFNVIGTLCLLYYIYVLIQAVKRNADGIFIIFTGMVVAILTAINDILYHAEMVNSSDLLPLGMAAVLTSEAALIARRSTSAFTKVEQLSESFRLFVPQKFLDHVAKEGIERIRLGSAEQENLSLLFADIRSFTNLAESMSPQEVLNFLNSYFRRMSRAIGKEGGYIDKFIGDGILALFEGGEETERNHARRALEAAMGMQMELNRYNLDRKQSGYRTLSIGIGVHSGPVIIGTVGAKDRMDSTVIGDAVNLASRLEGLTKYYQSKIIISGDTKALIDPGPEDPSPDYAMRQLDRVMVMGKEVAHDIYEVYESDDRATKENKLLIQEPYELALRAYFQGDFAQALEGFSHCKSLFGEDPLVKIYLKRCKQYLKHPPQEPWQGTFRPTHK